MPGLRLTAALLLGIATLGAAPPALAATETSTRLAADPASAVWGQAVTFTATVTAEGIPVTTGVVTFKEGIIELAPAVSVDGAGRATLTTTGLDVGIVPHDVVAYFTDASDTFAASDSSASPVGVTVGQANSALTAGFSPASVVVGQESVLTVNASAVAPGSGTPTGDVVLDDNPDYSQPLDVGRAVWGIVAGAGDLGLPVSYAGDAHFLAAPDALPSLHIDKATTSMTLTSAANPAAPGQAVAFTATLHVTPPADLGWLDGPQGSLQITLDGAPVGAPISVGGQYEFTRPITAPATPRTALVGVAYSGDDNAEPSSASLRWTVAPPPSPGTASPPPSALAPLKAVRTALAAALRTRGPDALTSTRQTFSAPGPGVLDQKVFTPTAPKSALKAASKPVLIASARRTARAAGPLAFRLKASAAGRRLLRRARSLKLTIVTRFTAPSGKREIVVSHLTVRTKAKRSGRATPEWQVRTVGAAKRRARRAQRSAA